MVNIMLAKDIATLLLGSFMLIYSGLIVVRSLIKLSYRMRISEFVISFILLAFSTSLPELFIGVTSAISKNPSLSLGNVIGANIMDVSLVIGIACLVGRKFKVKSKLITETSIFIIGIASITVILTALGNGLSRIDGAILMLISFVYMGRLIRLRKEYSKILGKEEQKDVIAEDGKEKEINKLKRLYLKMRDKYSFNLILFLIGMALVFVSARLVAQSAISLALDLNMPRILVGMILVSIGTTLPELVLEARAMLARHQQIAFGDAMGSVAINSTFILGLVAMIYPIEINSVNMASFVIGAIFMILSTLLLAALLNFKKTITWKDGLLLILFYIIFIIVQLNAKIFFVNL